MCFCDSNVLLRTFLWCFFLGKYYVREDSYQDSGSIKDVYKDYKKLTNSNFDKFIKNENGCIVSFLELVTKVNFSTENEKIKYAKAVCIEKIYFLRTLNLVMPCHFLANLVQSYRSGSKTLSMAKWMEEIGRCGSFGKPGWWYRCLFWQHWLMSKYVV